MSPTSYCERKVVFNQGYRIVSSLRFFAAIVLGAIAPSAGVALTAAVDAVKPDVFWQQGYTGNGIEIGIIDLFLADSSHSAISGNFLGSENFVSGTGWLGSHATSVVGAAVSQDPLRRGIAYGAGWWTGQTTNRGSITKQRTQTIAAETFAGGLGSLSGNPVEVLEMSIGLGGGDAATDQWSLALDHIVSTLGTTVVVAAGNDGPASNSFTGPPASAFNILSVGATGGTGAAITDDYSQIAPYSTRGPTDDGRSKPDIVAPGSLIELPVLDNTWSEGSGTSFAAPLVAGGAGLLIDMGFDRGMDIDALVIKSVLMNSADKLSGWSHTSRSPLDPNFGAGQMDLESAFAQYDAGEQSPGSINAVGWDHGTIVPGANNRYELDGIVPANTSLTATLVWNRPVATDVEEIETAIYTASALENLDLFLYEVSDPLTPVASSVSTVDNVEHLFLSVPSQGRYALEVRSAGGLVSSVSYSLAWNVDTLGVGLPGDYNGSGEVDATDYTVWRDTLGKTGTGLAADGNGNNRIDSGDYDVWTAHFGQTAGGDLLTNGVPEPTTVSLLLLTAVGGCVRRRTA